MHGCSETRHSTPSSRSDDDTSTIHTMTRQPALVRFARAGRSKSSPDPVIICCGDRNKKLIKNALLKAQQQWVYIRIAMHRSIENGLKSNFGSATSGENPYDASHHDGLDPSSS